MSAFTGALTVTHLDLDWRRWRLETPLRFEIGSLGSGLVVEAPPGMVTDGASVPRLLWSVLPAWGRYSRAAVIHDRLCDLINAGTPHVLAPTRRIADRIFLDAMKVSGVNRLVGLAMYGAVRAEARWRGKP
jgi:hypothetical protein